MSPKDIIRAWKDEEYLSSLSASERADLPPDPAGAIELSDRDLGDVSGGTTTLPCVESVVSVISAVTVITQWACPSLMHGTCSGWSYGCC
jgi:mersacidin/lichenicidin family type 2 lantibiotic